MSSTKIFNNLGIGTYELDNASSYNDRLNDIAIKLYNLDSKVSSSISAKNTDFNKTKESFIGAHTFPMNRLQLFSWFPKQFAQDVIMSVNNYAQESSIVSSHPAHIQFYIERCWCTITYPGDNIQSHTHEKTAILAMAYYSYFKPGQGNIILYDDIDDRLLNYFPLTKSDNSIELEPKENKCFIWPAYINHGTTINESDDVRISWSFDINAIGFNSLLPPKELVNLIYSEWNKVEKHFNEDIGEL